MLHRIGPCVRCKLHRPFFCNSAVSSHLARRTTAVSSWHWVPTLSFPHFPQELLDPPLRTSSDITLRSVPSPSTLREPQTANSALRGPFHLFFFIAFMHTYVKSEPMSSSCPPISNGKNKSKGNKPIAKHHHFSFHHQHSSSHDLLAKSREKTVRSPNQRPSSPHFPLTEAIKSSPQSPE